MSMMEADAGLGFGSYSLDNQNYLLRENRFHQPNPHENHEQIRQKKTC